MKDWAETSKPRKPTIIGIGAQKAGTTWLHDMLAQHPKVWVPPFKETHYFDYLHKPENRRWIPWHIGRTVDKLIERYERKNIPLPSELQAYLLRLTAKPMFTPDWYKHVFSPAPAGTRPMDITPEFSGLPDKGVDDVKRFLPRAQFIYILRHPVDRLISQLKMNLMRQNRLPETLAEWEKELDAPELYERGLYHQYVPRWQARFDESRLLILPFGMIAQHPLDFLRRCEGFLGLAAHDYTGLHKPVFSAPKGIAVPDEIRAMIRNRVELEFDFLADHFDEEFNSMLR